jgi:predicted RND superfamily exporter protein
MSLRAARRYVGWLHQHGTAVILASALVLAGSVYLIANHLRVFADFSYLLPQDAPAVRDLRRLEARVAARDTVLVLVVAPDATTRAAAADAVAAEIAKIDKQLVERIETDDKPMRDFLRARRHLFVPLVDLIEARDTLARRIEQAKLASNPLYVDIDDDDDGADEAAAAADRKRLEDLRARRSEAEARLDRSAFVDKGGTVALVVVRTAFQNTDVKHGERLLDALAGVRARVTAQYPVQIGVTGGVTTSVTEHEAVITGMILSGVLTAVLVAVVLVIYLRSATLLVLLTANIIVATTAAFGVAALTVGHLNATTAFLGAIIAGNGINYGIFLVARYLSARRRMGPAEAMADAINGTVRPTVVASLGVAIAYGSLAVTSFKGFADFAIIGAVGMLLCWIATFTLFPVLVLRFGRETRIYDGNPLIGRTLAWMFGWRRPVVAVVAAAAVTVVCGAVAWKYIADDPLEYDIRNLRSEGDLAVESRRWMKTSDEHFGRGISGRTFVAADRLDQVPLIVDALRSIDKDKAEAQRTIGSVASYLDVMPLDQEQRIAVLAEIRTLLDDPALDALDDAERAELRELRPPDDLKPITVGDLPAQIREQLSERDGRVGFIVAIRPAPTLDEWNGKDLIRFASAVRELRLEDDETITTSGPSVIFADIMASIENDGPLVTAVASIGLVVMVLLVVGRNRRAIAVLAATGLGSIALIAVCAAVGIKVNFLDFIALPITLGLGVDYAINIAHPAYHEASDPAQSVRNSGSSVFICSLTTIIGYGSLMVSDNLAIRGFGLASLIGEVTCVVAALAVVPAIIFVGRNREQLPALANSIAQERATM